MVQNRPAPPPWCFGTEGAPPQTARAGGEWVRFAPAGRGGRDALRLRQVFANPLGPGRRFFLVNRGGRLYAVSATCTHRRVALVAKAGLLKCPRHGSTFAADGKVTLTYKAGLMTSVRIFDGKSGEMLREIPVLSE